MGSFLKTFSVFLLSFLLAYGVISSSRPDDAFAGAGDVNVIAKLGAQNDSFIGLMDAKQIIGDGGSNVLPVSTIPLRYAGWSLATSSGNYITASSSFSVGIGTSTPGALFAVQGNGLFSGNISTANLTATGTLTIGTLSGILKAASGVVSTSLVNLASDVTGIVAVSNGGTGWNAITANTVLLGNGSGAISTTSAGTNGQVLALVSGVPTWVATSSINNGVSSLAQTFGTAQTGAVTFATSSQTTNGQTTGLNITNTAGAFTFAPTLSGTLTVGGGGTGQTTFASGQLLYGNGTNALSSVSTSTLAVNGSISSSGTLGAQVGGSNTTLSLNMANANSWTALQSFTNASTSLFSNIGTAYFGGTATTTISSNGSITTPAGSTLTLTPLTGILSSNAGSGVAARTLTGTTNQITVTNGNGTAGNPTFSIPTQFTISNASTTNFSANTLAVGGTGTTSISSTGSLSTPSLSIGSLAGVLYGNSGAVNAIATSSFTPNAEFTTTGTIGAFVGGTNSTLALATNGVALTKLAQIAANTILGNPTGATGNVTALSTSTLSIGGTAGNVTGIVAVSNGGTGWNAITANTVLLGNGSGAISTTSAGTNGQTLALVNGVPTWVSTTTLSTITGTLTVAKGGTGTTTAPSGQLLYGGGAGVYQSVATSSASCTSGVSCSGFTVVGAVSPSITNTGLLSLQQLGGGTAQTGAITFATSSATSNGVTIGLNITNTAGAFTFTPTRSGTLTVGGGGTGIAAVADGALLFGGTGGGTANLTALATSTGGTILQTSFTTGRPTWVATSTLGLGNGTFLGLSDTIGSYNANRVLFETASAVTDSANFTFNGTTLSVPTLSLTNALGLTSGGTATTTFYNGGVVFSDGTKLTQSSAAANFFWDETNNRLGIGTSSPQSLLHVQSSTGDGIVRIQGFNSNTGGIVQIRQSNLTGADVLYDGAIDAFQVKTYTSGSLTATPITIPLNGNVGIGTTTPTWLLNPSSSSAAQPALSAGAGVAQWAFRNAGGNLYFATTTVAGTATTSTSALTILGSSGNVGIASTSPGGQLSITNLTGTPAFLVGSAAHATQFIVDSTGNVGIGTTSPYKTLSVVGDIKSTGSIDADIQFLGQLADTISAPSFSSGRGTRIRASTDQQLTRLV